METMRNRMFSFCEREHISHILVSMPSEANKEAIAFKEQCRKRDISFIQSPAVIDWGTVQGILTPTAFYMKDGEILYPYSGSVIYGNTSQKQYQRIYFEMFLSYDNGLNQDSFENELSELLHDILHLHKKTNQYN